MRRDADKASDYKRRFLDGVAVPTSLVLRLSGPEFDDIANHVFAFDGAVVMKNLLSLSERRADFVLNYIAYLGDLGMKWRKLRLSFADIESNDFGYRDEDLGFPHGVTRHIDVDYAVRNHPDRLPKIEARLWQDHVGAELDGISFESHPSARFGGPNAPLAATVTLSWEPVGDESAIRIERIECRRIEVQFLSPATDNP